MKKALNIKINGVFHQWLKCSEAHFINKLSDLGKVTVEKVDIPISFYNLTFGTKHKIK